MNKTEGFITGVLVTAILCIIIAIVVRSLETYEKETKETPGAETESVIEETEPEQEETEPETEETEEMDQLPTLRFLPETDEEPVIVRIHGKQLDSEIASYLKQRLESYGIDYWFPYAIAQCFQESSFDPNAENRNGLDKGLFQYRITYWDFSKGDIFDWRAQIDLYVQQTERRLNQYGCSIYETISRHNTSDYGSYNQEYVNQVMQWVEPEC